MANPVGLRAAQSVVACPDRANPSLVRPMRISYLGIGSVDVVGLSGEVGTLIDRHLRGRLGERDPSC